MTATVGTVEHPIPMTAGSGESGTGHIWGTEQLPLPISKFPYPVTDTPVDPRIGTVGTRDVEFIARGIAPQVPPFSIVPPFIAGAPVVGATLNYTAGRWGGNPDPTIITNWARDNIYILGTLNTTNYVVRDQDRGHAITCIEEAVNSASYKQQASNEIFIPASGFSNGFSSGFK